MSKGDNPGVSQTMVDAMGTKSEKLKKNNKRVIVGGIWACKISEYGMK